MRHNTEVSRQISYHVVYGSVRFLDNFSAGAHPFLAGRLYILPNLCYHNTGTRGATSAEYFLKSGYAVIFMHRQFSLQPFSRHYSHSTNPFLDFLDIEPTCSTSSKPCSDSKTGEDVPSGINTTSQISVTPGKRPDLLKVLATYKHVHELGLLHTLTFVTVNDYLWLLRAVSQELAVLKRKSMFYLAAAVSDFFLPRQKMVSLFSTKIHQLTWYDSLNIKSNPGRAPSSSRWTKYLKSSSQWWTNGRQEDTSFHLRCFHVLVCGKIVLTFLYSSKLTYLFSCQTRGKPWNDMDIK